SDKLSEAASNRSANPILLPGMAMDIDLSRNWFDRFAWALPIRDPESELDLDTFRSQLIEQGMINEAESATLTIVDRSFSGALRNTPFAAAALPVLTDFKAPVVVHIDLSYFEPLYKNEISTPLLKIITNTLSVLKEKDLDVLAVTFSYGHLDNHIALDVRFIGHILTYLIEQPERFAEKVPQNWSRQADALYLANFFQKEKIRELYQAQEEEDPQAAWVKFNLYHSAAEFKDGSLALQKLGEAVALDNMYGLEYQQLSQLAFDRNRPDEAMRMLQLAAESFPDDPFIRLEMAQLAVEMEDYTTALHLVRQLQTLPWSPVYYPQMPDYLDGFATYLSQELAEPAEDQERSDRTPEQQRVLHPDGPGANAK
ncbi:MAG: hypothetical protein JRE16_02010, partial [Deltaproteobacteria bacterium]|nr:hypothetical protein [Deltaproteobacteria bacterium]